MLYLELFRRQRGLTQADLGNRTGLSQRDISDMELGRRPNTTQLKALAGFLGTNDINKLFEQVPPQLDFTKTRERVEKEFRGKHGLTDSIKIRTASAPDRHGVPAPPSLHDAIRKSRGE